MSPPGHQRPRPPLLANSNLFCNPNMVFESTYLCTATTKSLFPMAPGLQIPRSTEMDSLIDSSTKCLRLFTARPLYCVNAVFAVARRTSVCPSVCLSVCLVPIATAAANTHNAFDSWRRKFDFFREVCVSFVSLICFNRD